MRMTDLDLFGGVFKGKRVLITGDTGFKGSWLSLWLKELGAEVFGYALPPASEFSNFSKLQLEKHINHMDGDVRDLKVLEYWFKEVKPDAVFHLAAQPIVLKSYKEPQPTFETNLMGTVNFLECTRATADVKAAVVITSDKCYFNNEWIWGYKETDRLGGEDPYSASKACAELISYSYIKSYFSDPETCSIATARAGNVIGGGDWAENRIVPDFFRSVERNEKLILRYPEASRPWQYILEPLSGYLQLCSKLLTEGKKFQDAWNFGPAENKHYSVADLINRIIDQYGQGEIEIITKSSPFHETSMLKLEITKAIKLLGWHPLLSFDDTVDFTVKGYRDETESSDLYESRVGQILNYIEKTKERPVGWATK
ncbi:MAG: CDP-glucose 4,6-dehydratase [Syntrophothermus sp.]